MKRSLLIGICIVVIAGHCFAKDCSKARKEQDKDCAGKHAMMGKMPMMAMMQGKAQMLAASDGGVFVLAGNKLIKYDQNLTVVKEVIVPGIPEMKKPASMPCCGKGKAEKDVSDNSDDMPQ